MDCPRDRRRLETVAIDHARCYVCPECSGRALTVALLRRMMPAPRLHELWGLVRAGTADDAPCPSCERPMRRVLARGGTGGQARGRAGGPGDGIPVGGCTRCHVVWLGADALRALAPDAQSPRPVLDAPVPADGSDAWVWKGFFETLVEKRFEGPSFTVF